MNSLNSNNNRRSRGRLAGAFVLATNVGAGMLVCGLGGFYLDQKFANENQFWTVAGVFLGFAYLCAEIWKLSRMGDEVDKQEGNDSLP